jgi:hypothetical protein
MRPRSAETSRRKAPTLACASAEAGSAIRRDGGPLDFVKAAASKVETDDIRDRTL